MARTRERLEAYVARQNEGRRGWDTDGEYAVCRGVPVQRESRPHYC
jgi:hypothetical protein